MCCDRVMVDPLIRENTMAQTVIVVTNLINFLMFLPKIGLKMLSGLRSLIRTGKDIGVFVCCVIVFIAFVLILAMYTENHFNFRAKLSNILVPPTKTALEEF